MAISALASTEGLRRLDSDTGDPDGWHGADNGCNIPEGDSSCLRFNVNGEHLVFEATPYGCRYVLMRAVVGVTKEWERLPWRRSHSWTNQDRRRSSRVNQTGYQSTQAGSSTNTRSAPLNVVTWAAINPDHVSYASAPRYGSHRKSASALHCMFTVLWTVP